MNISHSERAFTIGAAILLVTLVGVGISLTVSLLSLEMDRMGVSGSANGLNTAVNGIANLVIVPFIPALAARFGIRRLLFAAIGLGAVTVLCFKLLPFGLWFPLRFLSGGALGTLFVLSEFWINAAAPPQRRGVIMGVYATMLALGFAAGPFLLRIVGTSGWPPYWTSAGLFLLALLPLLVTHGVTPSLGEKPERGRGVLGFLLGAPSATLAALVFGAVETAGFTFLPIYGLRIGFNEGDAASLLSILALGGVIFQIPLGLLSDRVDRRILLLSCALAGAIGAVVLPSFQHNVFVIGSLLFVFGGITGGLYTIGLAHLGSRYHGHDLASANAAFIMLYSAGLVAGPPLIGVGMDAFGANGFPGAMALLLGAYAIVVFWRLVVSFRKRRAFS